MRLTVELYCVMSRGVLMRVDTMLETPLTIQQCNGSCATTNNIANNKSHLHAGRIYCGSVVLEQWCPTFFVKTYHNRPV